MQSRRDKLEAWPQFSGWLDDEKTVNIIRKVSQHNGVTAEQFWQGLVRIPPIWRVTDEPGFLASGMILFSACAM